eukprot:5670563-Prymnesium_polylepis.1
MAARGLVWKFRLTPARAASAAPVAEVGSMRFPRRSRASRRGLLSRAARSSAAPSSSISLTASRRSVMPLSARPHASSHAPSSPVSFEERSRHARP